MLVLIQKRKDKPSEKCPQLLPPYETIATAEKLPEELTKIKDLKNFLFKRYGAGDYKVTFVQGGDIAMRGFGMRTVVIYKDGSVKVPEDMRKPA